MHTEEKYWYVIYCKPNWEKKISQELTKRQIENYCPVTRVQRQWSDRKKIVFEPLFTSYVFVRSSEVFLPFITKISGCSHLVYWLKKPAIVRNEEIDIIKSFLEGYSRVHVEKLAVDLQDSVRIIGGPLIEREGKVIEIKNETVKIFLPSLGFAMVAEVDKANIRLIPEKFGNKTTSDKIAL